MSVLNGEDVDLRVDEAAPHPALDPEVVTEFTALAPSGNGHHPLAVLRSSVPSVNRSVGTELLEVGGEELARSENTLTDLPYLPLLGAAGYYVRGWSHLTSGFPRVGKTDFTVANVREWLDQGLSVLYFTEEPRSIWEPRLAGLPGDWSRLRVVFGLGANVDLLRQRARRGHEDILVVDALRNLLQLRDEKDNSEIARVVNPWIGDARATGKTLVMLHHDRKGGGDHGEAVAGGHAFLGSFDVVLEILRDPNQASNRRLLRTYARLIESKDAIYERVEGGTFRLLGDPRALQRDEVLKRALPLLTEGWQTTDAVLASMDDPKPSKEQLRLSLVEAAKAGAAERDPAITETKQTRGKPHRWRLPVREGEANLVQEVEFQRRVL